MKCDRCGNRVDETDFFCEHCGARLRNRVSSGIDRSTHPSQANRRPEKDRRKTKAGLLRLVILICFIAAVVTTTILMIRMLINREVERTVETAEAMMTAVSAAYQDDSGQIPYERKEAVLDVIYEKANEGVLQGKYSFCERNGDCVVLGIPFGGDYVYMFSDPYYDAAPSPHINTVEATRGNGSGAGDPALRSPVDFRQEGRAMAPKLPKFSGIDTLRITTIQPFYTETRDTHPEESTFPDLAAQSIADSNGLYTFSFSNSAYDDERDDQEVSIDSLKSLSDFAVVIWHGHGGYSKKHGSLLATTVAFQQSNWRDWIKGRVIRKFGGDVAVSPAFFEHYLDKNANPNAIAYLAACRTGEDDRLANAFLGKGFRCVIANSDTISRSYNLRMLKAFFDGMSLASNGYLTTGQALAYAKTKYGNVDPLNEYDARPILFGDPDVRFDRNTQDEMDSPETNGDAENWKGAYTALLMQLLPQSRELYSYDAAICGDGICMALFDLNFDGVPELLDRYHMDNAYGDEYADVYYVKNGTAVLSATAHMEPQGGSSVGSHDEFMLYYDPKTERVQYVSVGCHGGSSDCGTVIYLWNSDATTPPSCKSLFYERGSYDVETLLRYGADEREVEQGDGHCYTYQYRDIYLSQGQYIEYQDRFFAQLQETEEPLVWFIDGDPLTYRPKSSVYHDVIAQGGSSDDAAKAIAELLFQTYEDGLSDEGGSAGSVDDQPRGAYEVTCRYLDNLLQSSTVQCIGKTYPEICQRFGYAKHFGWVPESTNCFYYEGIGEFYFNGDISDEDWEYLYDSGDLLGNNDLCPGDIALQLFPANDVCWAYLGFGVPEDAWGMDAGSFFPDTAVVGDLQRIDYIMDERLSEPRYEYNFPYKEYAITIRADADGAISKDTTIWINNESSYVIP